MLNKDEVNKKDFKIEEMTAAIVNRVAIIYRKKLSEEFGSNKINLTVEEFALLSRIWENGEISQLLLTKSTFRDKSRVARLLQKLENKGYISRIKNKSDKRNYDIILTQEGIESEKKITPIVSSLMIQSQKNIPDQDILLVQETLKKVYENLCEGG